MPEPGLIVLIVIVCLGLAFDFVNGFHDTANAIATSVATRVLSPGQAVTMAAGLNVVGALTGTAVASRSAGASFPRRSPPSNWWPPPSSRPSPGTW